MSKSQSGLGKLKRDWSNASMSAASSSQLIEWEPTPPKKPAPPADEKMEKANKRLLAIRQALASMEPDKPTQTSVPRPLERSTAVNSSRVTGKRPSLDSTDTATVKKRRELPPSWRDDALSDSSFPRTVSSSTIKSVQESRNGSASTISASSSNSSTSTKVNKVAKMFLSQEQTHILKLVQEGNSVFYTGSAGALN